MYEGLWLQSMSTGDICVVTCQGFFSFCLTLVGLGGGLFALCALQLPCVISCSAGGSSVRLLKGAHPENYIPLSVHSSVHHPTSPRVLLWCLRLVLGVLDSCLLPTLGTDVGQLMWYPYCPEPCNRWGSLVDFPLASGRAYRLTQPTDKVNVENAH